MVYIFGGAFNPPTLAHFNIVKFFLNFDLTSKVIIVPVGDDYKKEYLISSTNRLEMLEIMAHKLDSRRVIISDYEIKDGFKGTKFTLDYFKKKFGEVAFIMGYDQYLNIGKWINYKDLLEEYQIFVIVRQAYIDDKLPLAKKNIQFIDLDFKESSSDFRAKKAKKLLLEEVYEYIRNKKLYGE